MHGCNFMTHSRLKLFTLVQDACLFCLRNAVLFCFLKPAVQVDVLLSCVSWTARVEDKTFCRSGWCVVVLCYGRLVLRIRRSDVQRLHLCNTFCEWPVTYFTSHKAQRYTENMMNNVYGMSSYKQVSISLTFPWYIPHISLLLFGFVCFLHKSITKIYAVCSCAHHVLIY